MSEPDDVRYGVFLVPDARTSAAVTDVAGYVRAQFGLVSAGRFPPHVTLAGSLPLAVGEKELLTVVQAAVESHGPVQLTNSGVRRLGDAVIVFDVHHTDRCEPNLPLVQLAVDVGDAVRPLLAPCQKLAPDIRNRESWRGHLSLASHELLDRPDLRDEVQEFIEQLEVPYPASFVAARLGVYRLHHRDWSQGWWRDFTWEHVQSVRLG